MSKFKDLTFKHRVKANQPIYKIRIEKNEERYFVVIDSSICIGDCHSFDNKEDAVAYRKMMIQKLLAHGYEKVK